MIKKEILKKFRNELGIFIGLLMVTYIIFSFLIAIEVFPPNFLIKNNFDLDECTMEIISVPCLSGINYIVPSNFSGCLDFKMHASESCYDLINDPLGYRFLVDRAFDEFPDNTTQAFDAIFDVSWPSFDDDPIVKIIFNDTIDQVIIEKIYNKTKNITVCR